MASTNFIDKITTIAASWLNAVDAVVYGNGDSTRGSALVQFIQAGLGAIASTMQRKARETISVFDFMTEAQIADVQAGTMSLDVTTAVQTALDVISDYDELLFPRGAYKITSALNVTFSDVWQGVTIRGVGPASRLVWAGGNNNKMLHIRGTTGSGWYSKNIIEKLQFYGESFTGDTYSGVVAIQLGNTPEDIYSGIGNTTIRNCLIRHVATGILGFYESDECVIHDNYIERFTDYGVYNSHGGSGWNITNNHISDGKDTSTAIRASLSAQRIQGNVIQSGEMSIAVQVDGGVTSAGKTVSVCDNYFESQTGGDYGVIFYGVSTGVIENNTFNGFPGSTLIYLGDVGGVSCDNVRIGPNRHTQSGGVINYLAYATAGSTNCNIDGEIVTTGSVTTISGPFARYGVLSGQFTPGVSFGGGTTGITYAGGGYTLGRYTKTGTRVDYQLQVILSNKGSSVGDVLITGLPFTALNALDNNVPAALSLRNVSFADYPQASVVPNSTTIALTEITNAGSVTSITDSDFSNSSEVYISGSYTAAS